MKVQIIEFTLIIHLAAFMAGIFTWCLMKHTYTGMSDTPITGGIELHTHEDPVTGEESFYILIQNRDGHLCHELEVE